MNQFVIEVDCQKTIDFEEIEVQYGAELAQKLKKDLEYADEKELDWKLEIEDDPRFMARIIFCLRSSVTFYEVLKERKKVTRNYIVGKIDCEKYLDLMGSIEEVKQ